MESRIVARLIGSVAVYGGGAALAIYVGLTVAHYVTHVFSTVSTTLNAVG